MNSLQDNPKTGIQRSKRKRKMKSYDSDEKNPTLSNPLTRKNNRLAMNMLEDELHGGCETKVQMSIGKELEKSYDSDNTIPMALVSPKKMGSLCEDYKSNPIYIEFRENENKRHRKYRSKLSEDQRELIKLKDRERYRLRKELGLQKNIHEMSDQQKKKQRDVWKKYQRKYRDKHSQQMHWDLEITKNVILKEQKRKENLEREINRLENEPETQKARSSRTKKEKLFNSSQNHVNFDDAFYTENELHEISDFASRCLFVSVGNVKEEYDSDESTVPCSYVNVGDASCSENEFTGISDLGNQSLCTVVENVDKEYNPDEASVSRSMMSSEDAAFQVEQLKSYFLRINDGDGLTLIAAVQKHMQKTIVADVS